MEAGRLAEGERTQFREILDLLPKLADGSVIDGNSNSSNSYAEASRWTEAGGMAGIGVW